ncbi:MAG: energy transducer TonB [Nitrospirae bacterium]|nr:energy transducer TonB [Nitrospirota bacterium]
MRKGLILMFMLSLLGHIAAAGMLYVAGAYGVWDKDPRDGMDDQRENAVKVLWGFVDETPMSRGLTKEHRNNPPYSPFIKGGDSFSPPLEKGGGGGFDRGISSDESLRPRLKSSAEESRPVAHHEWRADDTQESVAPAEMLSHSDPEADNTGLYGHHPDPAAEANARSAGLYDRHSNAETDGLVPSTPSTLSAGTGGDCSRSAACMGADAAVSEVYPGPGIDEAGGRGRGSQGEGLKTFLEALRVEIERHKNYPPFARKNGIEGTAYLNFHIGDDGKPGGIILEKSSGSKILDESAIHTLKSMERFYPVPEEIRELKITVPIAYRLVED